MLFVEWCSAPNHRSGAMVAVDDLPLLEKSKDSGFRGVYEYDQAAAEEIRQLGSSKNLARFQPHSSVLFIDLDNGDKDVPRLKEWAKDTGTEMTLFSSGGKGYHSHISILPMVGQNVPASQSNFVSGIGIENDPSLYRPGSLIALPGRLHPKTHKKKAKVEYIQGVAINVPLLEQSVKKAVPQWQVDEETTGFTKAMHDMWVAQLCPPRNGERYLTLWKIARALRESGVPADHTFVLLHETNKRFPQPKEVSEIERAIQDAYKI